MLVANAGLPGSGRLDSFSVEEIDRALTVNLRAPMLLAHTLASAMVERGRGHLVFMSSLSGQAAAPGSSRLLRDEVRPARVRSRSARGPRVQGRRRVRDRCPGSSATRACSTSPGAKLPPYVGHQDARGRRPRGDQGDRAEPRRARRRAAAAARGDGALVARPGPDRRRSSASSARSRRPSDDRGQTGKRVWEAAGMSAELIERSMPPSTAATRGEPPDASESAPAARPVRSGTCGGRARRAGARLAGHRVRGGPSTARFAPAARRRAAGSGWFGASPGGRGRGRGPSTQPRRAGRDLDLVALARGQVRRLGVQPLVALQQIRAVLAQPAKNRSRTGPRRNSVWPPM